MFLTITKVSLWILKHPQSHHFFHVVIRNSFSGSFIASQKVPRSHSWLSVSRDLLFVLNEDKKKENKNVKISQAEAAFNTPFRTSFDVQCRLSPLQCLLERFSLTKVVDTSRTNISTGKSPVSKMKERAENFAQERILSTGRIKNLKAQKTRKTFFIFTLSCLFH